MLLCLKFFFRSPVFLAARFLVIDRNAGPVEFSPFLFSSWCPFKLSAHCRAPGAAKPFFINIYIIKRTCKNTSDAGAIIERIQRYKWTVNRVLVTRQIVQPPVHALYNAHFHGAFVE